MRRLLVLLVVVALAALGAALALIVFRSGLGAGEAGGPLDEALGYLPANTPFAAAVPTDPKSEGRNALDSLLGRFPFGGQVKDELRGLLEAEDLDYERDVEPLLGNELVVGATEVQALRRGQGLVAAISLRDRNRLRELIEQTGHRSVRRVAGGGELFVKRRRFLAVRGDVLVMARSRARLEAALAQRSRGDRLTVERFDAALAGLPRRPLVRLYGDPQTMIGASRRREQLRQARWIAALRTMGATVSLEDDRGAAVDFALRTEPEGLTDADLPFPAGPESPFVVTRNQQLVVGARGVEQFVRFLRGLGPAGGRLAGVEAVRQALERRLHLSLDREVIGQFRGAGSVLLDRAGRFGLRSELSDPASLEERLRATAGRLPAVKEGSGLGRVRVGPAGGASGLYRLTTLGGDAVFGVKEGAFVVAQDVEGARALASAPPAAVEGAQGSVAVRANAESLANRLIARSAGGLSSVGASFFTGPLGDLTGSARTSTEGMRGRLKLEIE